MIDRFIYSVFTINRQVFQPDNDCVQFDEYWSSLHLRTEELGAMGVCIFEVRGFDGDITYIAAQTLHRFICSHMSINTK